MSDLVRLSAGCDVYILTAGYDDDLLKIGVSRNLLGRFRALQGGLPYRLTGFEAWRVETLERALFIERETLAWLSGERLRGEWLACPFTMAYLAVENVLLRSGASEPVALSWRFGGWATEVDWKPLRAFFDLGEMECGDG